MADLTNKLNIIFRCYEDIDLSDVASARAVLIGMVNDDGFKVALEDLGVTMNTLRGGPAPRGGEVGGSCHVDTHGGGGCEVHGSWRF